jgi:hypothetical protein
MNAPYAIATVMVNENIKKVIKPKERKFKFLSYFFCAATAGAIAATLTCPMDNIKTKLQTQVTRSGCDKLDALIKENKIQVDTDHNNKSNTKTKPYNTYTSYSKPDCNPEQPSSQIKYKNILSTMRYIYNEDGFFRGFFKGLTPRVLSTAPSCAISWVTYEAIKHLLSKEKKKK